MPSSPYLGASAAAARPRRRPGRGVRCRHRVRGQDRGAGPGCQRRPVGPGLCLGWWDGHLGQLSRRPAARHRSGPPQGTLAVFGTSGREGVEVGKVVGPVVFGRVLIDPYHGFAWHTVVAGDTLSALAQRFYDDAATWPQILEANRDQILNPDLIFPGQTLRIPQ